MDYNILVLKNILTDMRYLIDCSDDYYQEFEYDVISKYNEYSMSIYVCLMELYPVIFMHIAFYEIYLKHCTGNAKLLDFKSYFIQYQKYSMEKYTKMLNVFYNKIQTLNPIDDLSDMINELHI
jgi:hypothetical protein